MASESFSWIHLTDLHFGLRGQKFLWPNLREAFFQDLAELHSRSGPWHAVLFTGDLVQQGSSDEFNEMQKQVLDRLWQELTRLGSGGAVLLPVPGNHDLVRPDPKSDDPAIDVLLDSDRFSSVSNKFWGNASGAYRAVVDKAFAPYSEWWKTTPYRPENVTNGILPGDFSCSITTGKYKVGLVGLNTAFLQLNGGNYKGKLTWDVRQLHAVCEGAIDDWVMGHTVCILLTHQGPEWLTPDSRKHGESEIAPAGRFAMHLFGHMHETSISYSRIGGSPNTTRLYQGSSVFGMERFGEPPKEVRNHGYAVGRIVFDADKATLRIWPRAATDHPQGAGWRYVPDIHNAVLENDHGTASEVLLQPRQGNSEAAAPTPQGDQIPVPPMFYALPPYISSHSFIGRKSELDILDDWARPADAHSVMLFDAIGGTGKSLLTWEWSTQHSSRARNDWAGRFWYSFYEKGATMSDFCRRALGYMMGRPPADFKRRSTSELAELLVRQLQTKPWLLVLDGLERILVSYHRFDAAQVRDEDAGRTDEIARRDPCAAINPDDEGLLRALAAALPSKVLISTRLVPRALLNRSNQPIPGVLRQPLTGLRAQDAEAMIRACGVTGTALEIQNYLKTHCDCHPLVIGVLAGLINDYLPDRGNFDAWASAPDGGLKLNLAKLDLVQKRNNILQAAFVALEGPSRQLLSTIALLSGATDYSTLCALNPLLPPLPEATPRPKKLRHNATWRKLSEPEQKKAEEDHLVAVQRRKEYLAAIANREEDVRSASPGLVLIVKDLERRGLLQYDALSRRYDLHPVVRGVAVGGLKHDERDRFGRRVVDHFSLQAQDPYSQAESLDDFSDAKHIIRTLFHMGREDEAYLFLKRNDSFLQSLNTSFEAHNEILGVIRPFFKSGWGQVPDYLARDGGIALARKAAVALRRLGALEDADEVSTAAIRTILGRKGGDVSGLFSHLMTWASTVGEQNRLALEDRILLWAWRLAPLIGIHNSETYNLARFRQLSRLGMWEQAAEIGNETWLEASGIAAHHYVVYLYQRGTLTESELNKASDLNFSTRSALGIRNLLALRGFWLMEKGNYLVAKESLREALVHARKVGIQEKRVEVWFAVAQHKTGELIDPYHSAERLTHDSDDSCHRALSNLWLAIGNLDRARTHAILAYKWAWADGMPFVRHSELAKAQSLLNQLDVPVPSLPDYDPTVDKEHDWEHDLEVVLNKLIAARTQDGEKHAA